MSHAIDKQALKAALDAAIAALCEEWDRERDVERVLGFDVIDMQHCLETYAAVDHDDLTHAEVEQFLEWARLHRDGGDGSDEQTD